ncbi:hypothetical protein CFRS1_v014971 [Colletotrichum fructicola]|nr:hypothetical protein CFRS1_v014971 [Colletotrichum fructicola]
MASAWVIDTVDYGLRQSSCRAMWDLRTWYANLRTSVGATEREQQTAARRKYQTATKILSSVPKDFAGWITSWEMATNHALVRKTGGVEDPNTWFEDLTRAIQPIFGGWVTIYAGIYKDKLEEKTLTIGEVAKDLRKEAERRDLLGLQEKGSRLTRGVFGPTFATGQSQSMLPQLEATPSNEEGDTQTRNQATVAIEIGFRFSVLQQQICRLFTLGCFWLLITVDEPAAEPVLGQSSAFPSFKCAFSDGEFWRLCKLEPLGSLDLALAKSVYIRDPFRQESNSAERTHSARREAHRFPFRKRSGIDPVRLTRASLAATYTHVCIHMFIKTQINYSDKRLNSCRIKLYQSARRAGVPGPLGASYGRSAPAYSRAGLGQPITSYPTQSVGD